MSSNNSIAVLSLGAGVQSTALALMAEKGLVEKPVAAVFADTGDEPPAVYEHLEKLKGMLSFPVRIVSQGHLGNDFLEALSGQRKRCSQPPFHVRSKGKTPEEIKAILAEPEPSDPDLWHQWSLRRKLALRPDEGGMLWRNCTKDYKIIPIRREVRKIMKETGARHVRQQIGISTDERQREKLSGVKFITNVFPLLELDWSRHQCEMWLKSEFGLVTAKSACYYCPYRSNTGWSAMKRNDPEQFERACQFDEKMREFQDGNPGGAGITGQVYVWRGLKPLREAVFSEDVQHQFDFGMVEECDGMCGL